MDEANNTDRAAILENEVFKYSKKGYEVVNRTETSVQLRKERRFFTFGTIFLTVVTLGLWLLVELLFLSLGAYKPQVLYIRTPLLYISVDQGGE